MRSPTALTRADRADTPATSRPGYRPGYARIPFGRSVESGEKIAIVVTLGLECRRSALIGHHPIVVGLFGVLGSIVFGNMGKDAQAWLVVSINRMLEWYSQAPSG